MISRFVKLLILFVLVVHAAGPIAADVFSWTVSLNVGTVLQPEWLPVNLELHEEDGEINKTAWLINGHERIPVGPIGFVDDQLIVDIPHYQSTIALEIGNVGDLSNAGAETTINGVWRKVRGEGKVFEVPCQARNSIELNWDDPSQFEGRWKVEFKGDEDVAVGLFQKESDSNLVLGTFLTTTGDYRYLAGGVKDGRLQLSCFDGAHAFLFDATLGDGQLKGTFRSGNWFKTEWIATKNENVSLPDGFGQTELSGRMEVSELQFPNLDGDLVSLSDKSFAGKCRIIEVFGSWCPNCHDAGQYLSELHDKYSSKGLSIVGLAFELTGELEKDAAQVRTFIERNDTRYPILIAGTSDKKDATEQLKVLDRVRSYPTMIFLDEKNNVRAIYTGFSGPATGEAHQKLRLQFETLIEKVLNE